MSFQVNQRVRMKRTTNEGTVTLLMPGNLVQVKLDGGLGHIPIPAEALELVAQDDPPAVRTEAPPVLIPATARRVKVSKNTLREGNGIQLAFDPQLNNEAEPVAFEVYLINSSEQKIIFEVKALTGSSQRWSKSGLVEAGKKKRIDVVDYRWLSEKLAVELDVRAVLLGGTGPRHFEKINVKPKQFFASYVEVPELYREAHLYTVFPEISVTNTAPAAAPSATSSLRQLTQQQIAKRPKKTKSDKRLVQTDLQEKLEFQETLDLHLTALVKDPATIARHEVLPLQLKTFDEYIDRALRMGVDSVFVIHGVGNGVLKRAIHSRLHRIKFIREFKNEYHHKYGFGATEIIFD